MHDDRLITDLTDGVVGAFAVAIAHDLGVFRLLNESPRTTAELGAAIPVVPRRIQMLLTLCAAAGLVASDGGCYVLTDFARDYLVESSATYQGALFELVLSRDELLRGLLEATKYTDGQRPWIDALRGDAQRASRFTRAMHGHSMAPALAWPAKFDLARFTRMLDIGGGSGAHAIGALQRWPHLAAIVLDLPTVCSAAREYVTGYRIRLHEADMFRDPLPDADLHFYSDIFHDWTPEECAVLARRSFDALPAGGCIMVHEMLLHDDEPGPFTVAASSLAMLAICGGQQYAGRELAGILRDAGFVDIDVVPTFGYWSIVRGEKR